jgi:hypothetical protein
VYYLLSAGLACGAEREDRMIWQLVQSHLKLIIQALLPFGFLIVDSLLKWTSGKKDFKDTGADVCLAGYSLYVGTLLGLLYDGAVQRASDVVTALVILFFGTVAWWLCIVLSYSGVPLRRRRVGVRGVRGAGRRWVQPVAAIIIGSMVTFYLAGLSWELTSTTP